MWHKLEKVKLNLFNTTDKVKVVASSSSSGWAGLLIRMERPSSVFFFLLKTPVEVDVIKRERRREQN